MNCSKWILVVDILTQILLLFCLTPIACLTNFIYSGAKFKVTGKNVDNESNACTSASELMSKENYMTKTSNIAFTILPFPHKNTKLPSWVGGLLYIPLPSWNRHIRFKRVHSDSKYTKYRALAANLLQKWIFWLGILLLLPLTLEV